LIEGRVRRTRAIDRERIATRWLPEVRKPQDHSEKSICSVGSGPRGRWFESTRPDQFLQKSSETCRVQSGSSLGFDAQIASREPSAPYFKRRSSEELFDISTCRWFSSRTSAQAPGSNLYAHLMLIGSNRHPAGTRARLASWRCPEDRSGYNQPVEVVGEISGRDVSRAERLGARNSAWLRREWARLHAKH